MNFFELLLCCCNLETVLNFLFRFYHIRRILIRRSVYLTENGEQHKIVIMDISVHS